MTIKKIFILSSALLFALPTLAQSAETPSQTKASTPIKPYGDNPNIFHVFGYKAQQGVINGVEKVDELAGKGISKVKPSVDRVWGNTKSATNNTVQQVDQGAQHVTQNVNEKLKDTREAITGKSSQPAPITQQSLSESSSGSQINTTPSNNAGQNSNQYPQSSYPSSSTSTTYPVTDL
ncbi:MAG: hypothetical protein ACN6NV_14995 [Acinetobacter gandensis]|uniref:hypothetical protein n=1 Tax=Acinetobacter gandensis TaxID=1443941 RepID=UPI003D070608